MPLTSLTSTHSILTTHPTVVPTAKALDRFCARFRGSVDFIDRCVAIPNGTMKQESLWKPSQDASHHQFISHCYWGATPKENNLLNNTVPPRKKPFSPSFRRKSCSWRCENLKPSKTFISLRTSSTGRKHRTSSKSRQRCNMGTLHFQLTEQCSC